MTDTLPRRGTETPATTPRAAAPAASASTVDVAALPVVRLKHWFRWTLAAIIVFALAQFVWSLVTNENYEWDVFAHYFFAPPVLQGVGLTLLFTGLSAAIGFLLGTLIALARLSKSPLLSSAAWLYVWFFRSVPLVVQLVVWYNLGYLYPTLGLGTPFTTDFWLVEFPTVQLISAFAAGVLGLSLHQAAYSAEIIRGGLLSVDQGQLEAAASLGIPPRRRLTRIVLPQAMRSIVPNATNEVIGLVKGTSVLFVIAIPELFYAVQVIYTSPRPAAEARRAGGFTSRGRRRRGSGRRRRGARGCATTGSTIRGRRGRRPRPARARVPSA
ncbi:amino acid ABC transporter permease [Microbacterium lacticum]